MNDVDYGADSQVEVYGEDRYISLDYDRLVEMGGWDLDFFNKAVAGFGVGTVGNKPQDVMDLMLSFVNTEFERAWSVMDEMLDRVEEATITGSFSVVKTQRDFSENQTPSQRLTDFEIAVADTLYDMADEHANQALRLVPDEVATIYTAGGCYLFEEPFAIVKDRSRFPESVEKMLPHLFRFQTNLFFSTVILYIDELDKNRLNQSMSFGSVDDISILDLIESAAMNQRRLGETP